MMRLTRLSAVLLAALALGGCQRGTGGPLEASGTSEAAPGGDRAVTLVDAGLTAKVSGRWSSQGANSLQIIYSNTGPGDRKLDLSALAMTHPLGEAALATAVDATGVDLADKRADNDRPRVIYELQDRPSMPAVLDVPAGATREVDAELTSFANDGQVAAGDRVTAAIPMGARTMRITLVAARPAIMAF